MRKSFSLVGIMLTTRIGKAALMSVIAFYKVTTSQLNFKQIIDIRLLWCLLPVTAPRTVFIVEF